MCRYCDTPEEIFDGVENKPSIYFDHYPDGWYVEAYPTWDDNDFGTKIHLVFVRDERDQMEEPVKKMNMLSDVEGWHLASWNHEFMCYEIGAVAVHCPVCGRALLMRSVHDGKMEDECFYLDEDGKMGFPFADGEGAHELDIRLD